MGSDIASATVKISHKVFPLLNKKKLIYIQNCKIAMVCLNCGHEGSRHYHGGSCDMCSCEEFEHTFAASNENAAALDHMNNKDYA